MSKPTKDLRLVVPEYVHDVLDTEAAGTHDDIHAIARQVLERWARDRHRVHKLYAKRLRSKGLQMELDGIEPEDDGTLAGKSR